MSKVVILDSQQYPDGSYSEIGNLCFQHGIEFEALKCTDTRSITELAADADVIITIFLKIDRQVIESLPRCRMVIRHGIGVDVLNLPDLTAAGVVACNVPDYGTEEVAIHTLALILALERKVALFDRVTRSGDWDESAGYEMRRISERKLGLIGFGRIARKLTTMAQAIGYTVSAHDPFVDSEVFTGSGVTSVSVDQLLSESDVLALMAPANEHTRRLINDVTLSRMKRGVLIVNTSRGALMDPDALDRALQTGQVAGAALDVLEHEPPSSVEKSLMRHESVIITPHVAYRSLESLASLKRICGEIAVEYLRGGPPRNVVNPSVLDQMRHLEKSHG